jgi:hypothetical protein
MPPFTYADRLDALRIEKLRQTQEKIDFCGSMDHDDKGILLPPPEMRQKVETISGSGQPVVDCVFNNYRPQSNHPNGGWYGPRISGANFRALLDRHPVYIDPNSSLAGGYMVSFLSYRPAHWNPDFDFSFLQSEMDRYQINPALAPPTISARTWALGCAWVGAVPWITSAITGG